ncbi:MAG: hypothetical protein AB1414_20685 [bacterium]
MRILDLENDKTLQEIGIYLTPGEVKQMIGYLEDMLKDPKVHHAHINDDEYQREITISIYCKENMNQFDERSKKIILEEEGGRANASKFSSSDELYIQI